MATRPPSLGAQERKAAAAALRAARAQPKTLESAAARAATRAAWAAHDARREPASKRGYGQKWRGTRERILAQNPLCALCATRGLLTPATLVDHINPVQSAADPGFYNPANLQPLCRRCHGEKTAQDIAAGTTRGPCRPARKIQKNSAPPPAIRLYPLFP